MGQEEIGRRIGILYRRIHDFANPFCQRIGLTPLESIFLTSLFETEGLIQEDLSRQLAVDKSATARILKSLEAKGFITRLQSSADGRSKQVFPTAKALEYKDYLLSALASLLRSMTRGVDPADLATTLGTLEALASNLGRMTDLGVDAPPPPQGVRPRPRKPR